jgi:Flp pilus assembly protein TadG
VGEQRQRGQTLVLIALMLAALTGMAAIAIDLTSAMSDRRILQAAADSAALAGVRSYPQGTGTAHWVAMQYLASELGLTLPVGSCSAASCPAGAYTSGPYTVSLADATPLALDVSVRHRQPTLFASILGFPTVTSGASGRATQPQPATTTLNYALGALSGDAEVKGGGTSGPTGDVGGPIYAQGSFGANNGSHAPTIPTVQTGYDGVPCPGSPQNHLDNGGATDSLAYQWSPTTGVRNSNVAAPGSVGAGPVSSGPTYKATAAAKDAKGNWNPGIYDGVYPSGGKMNPGVYQVVNVTGGIGLGTITNAIPAPSGVLDSNGAVAIVLDGTDTGSLDMSGAVLNGVDDLGSTGTRDPQGTHNFVLYGATYQGGVTGDNVAVTGVVYLPKSQLSFNGNTTAVFTGSVLVASVKVVGGGNGTQVYNWICGLQTVDGSHSSGGGLVR